MHFIEELRRQMAARNLSAAKLAVSSSIPASTLSRWLANDTEPTFDAIEKVGNALSMEPTDQDALVVARLRDICPHHRNHRIAIEQLTSYLQDRPRTRSKWERAVQFLDRERHQNPEIHAMLVSLAKALGCDDL